MHTISSTVLQIYLTGTAHSFMISISISTFTFQVDSQFNFSIMSNALEKEPTVFTSCMRSEIDLMSENNVIQVMTIQLNRPYSHVQLL